MKQTIIAIWVFCGLACQALELPDVISDNMLLQADQPSRIWGWAAPGETVQVEIAGQRKTAVSDAAGSWSLHLDPMPASGTSLQMTVKARNKHYQLSNILIGDVWLAGGQSNMAWPVKSCLSAPEEIAAADVPQIRIFMADRVIEAELQKNTKGRWVVCSPETVGEASGAAYFHCRELLRKTGRPQAFLNVNWGGTPIESWMSRAVLESDPRFAASLERSWKHEHWVPSSCYRSMLAPLYPTVLRGILWYQGEGNAARPQTYRALFTALIREWRAGFGQGDLPFYFVQIATKGNAPREFAVNSRWSQIREAQMLALAEPATGMAVTYDLGISGNVHYPNKQAVGHRLASMVLEDLYGIGRYARSPLFESVEIKDGRAVILFRHAGQGLAFSDDIKGLVIAGSDGRFFPAMGKTIGTDRIEVWCDQVPKPVSVRYAWSDYPLANLTDKNGFPVSGFRTDLKEVE